MSTLTELPDRDAAIALHEALVRSSPARLVTPSSAAAMAAKLAKDPTKLIVAWEILGAWALRELDRMVLTEGRVRERRDRPKKATQKAGEIVDPKATRSWYQKLPLWKRPIAIGNTGRRKALGELTHGDCQTLAQFYLSMASTMQTKGDRWGVISRLLAPGQKLGDAQLAQATLEWLRDEAGGEGGSD